MTALGREQSWARTRQDAGPVPVAPDLAARAAVVAQQHAQLAATVAALRFVVAVLSEPHITTVKARQALAVAVDALEGVTR